MRDEDTEMEDGTPQTVLCKECLNQKRMTLFCSRRCAGESVSEHIKRSHGIETSTDEAGEAVTLTQEVVEATLAQENPGLTMTRIE